MSEVKRLLVVTSTPSTYRIPVFESLGRKVSLYVYVRTLKDSVHRWKKSDTENFLWANFLTMLRLFLNKDVSVIITMWERPLIYLLAWIRIARGLPVHAFYESTELTHRFKSGLVAWARQALFLRLKSVVCVGESSYQTLIRMKVNPERIVKSFNAVNVEFFAESTRILRQNAPSAMGSIHIFVGQLIERKNLFTIIEAWVIARKKSDKLLIVGEGPLLDILKSRVRELGLHEYVEFKGYLRDLSLAAAYAQSETLILASKKEVWGLVVNEALSCGLQAIVTENCGVAESIRGMRGVYIVKNDIDSLAKAIKESAKSWSGPIKDPEILKHTTGDLANAILEAIYKE